MDSSNIMTDRTLEAMWQLGKILPIWGGDLQVGTKIAKYLRDCQNNSGDLGKDEVCPASHSGEQGTVYQEYVKNGSYIYHRASLEKL